MKEFFDKIKKVMIKPRDFFAETKKEGDFSIALEYFLLLVLVMFPFGLVASILFNSEEPILDIVVGYPIGLVIGITVLFIIIAFYHLFIFMLGGRQGILRTCQAFLYGATAGILLSWLPIVNLLAAFYSVYLTITGISVLQEMKAGRAVLAYFLPLAAIFIFAVILVVLSLTLGGPV